MKRWMALGFVALLAIYPIFLAWAGQSPKTGVNYVNLYDCPGCFIYLEYNGYCMEDNECGCVSWIGSQSKDCSGLFTENIIYFPFDEIAYNTDPNGEKNKKEPVRGNTSCVTRWACVNDVGVINGTCNIETGICTKDLMVENYCRQCKDGKFKSLSQIRLDKCKDCPEEVK